MTNYVDTWGQKGRQGVVCKTYSNFSRLSNFSEVTGLIRNHFPGVDKM